MAKLPSGIMSTPRGKLSREFWISPKTGKFYSPPPRHKDKRSPQQLEHRRRMRVLAPLMRIVSKLMVKPIWGKRIKYLTPYSFSMGITMAFWAEPIGHPWLWLLFPPSQNYYPLWFGSDPDGNEFWMELMAPPPGYEDKSLMIGVFAWQYEPFRFKWYGYVPWLEGTAFKQGWRRPFDYHVTYWKTLSYYRDSAGLFIYVNEGYGIVGLNSLKNVSQQA